jgi:hypothetical protein
MRKQEMIAKIERAAAKYKRISLDLAGADNPQVIRLRNRAEAKQEAYEIVLLAMRGNSVSLDIEAG